MIALIQRKPASVLVIGWLLIFISLVSFVLEFTEDSEVELIPEHLEALSSAYGYITTFVLLYTSIQFLRLKKWSRSVLEILTWLHLVESVTFPVLLIFVWPERVLAFIESVVGHPPDNVTFFLFNCFIVVICCFMMAIGIVILYFLRSATVRNAMKSAHGIASS